MKEKLLIAILTIVLVGVLVASYYVARFLAPPEVGPQPDVSTLLPAIVGPQPTPPTPLPTTVNFKNYLIVSPSGGNFTRLSAALDSIMDASADNRYTIVLRGTIVENGNEPGVPGYIDAKSHIDVVGQGATLELWVPERTEKDYTVQFMDVFDAEWRDLNIVAKEVWNQRDFQYTGDSKQLLVDIEEGTTYVIKVRGRSDKTLRLTNIRTSWDLQSGSTFSTHGGVIQDMASPIVTNSEFLGGHYEASQGFVLKGTGSPVLMNCRFVGGGNLRDKLSGGNYGLIIQEGNPAILSSIAEGGLGNHSNHAVYISGGAPTLIGVVGKPQEFSYAFNYNAEDSSDDGSFRPDIGADSRYMVRTVSVTVPKQSHQWTVNVGVTPGGSELASISGSGNMTSPYKTSVQTPGYVAEAGSYLHVTTVGTEGIVYLKYTVMPADSQEGYVSAGLYMDASQARITWSMFYGTWEWNPPLAFTPEAGVRPKWQITGSSFIQLWKSGGGLAAYSAMNYFGKFFDMPVYYSSFEGGFYNVRPAEHIVLPSQTK